MQVSSKKLGQQGIITAIAANEIVVKLEQGKKEARFSPADFLQAQWKQLRPVAEAEKLQGMERFMPKVAPAMRQLKVKADVALALVEACAEDCTASVEIHTKPRGCTAMKKFGKGKLILVPATTNVRVVSVNTEVPKNYLPWPVKGMKDLSVYLAPCQAMPKGEDDMAVVAAFWWCKVADKEEDANMKMDVMAGVPIMKNLQEVQKGDPLVVYGRNADAPRKGKSARTA